MKWLCQAGLLAIGLAVIGCNRPAAPTVPATSQSEGIRRREVADLPAIGSYQPPLDGSLLEVAPPAGWKLTKGRTFLIGFAKENPADLPRIEINAEEPPPGSPAKLTEENAAAFAAQLDQQLKADVTKRVEEYSLPIVLGRTVFVRHVRQVKGNSPCVLQSLKTIQNSRLYTVDLIVEIDAPQASQYEKSLLGQRDYGYAVAANMRFAPPGEKFDPLAGLANAPPAKAATKTDGKTPASKPAESKPANKKPADKKSGKPKPPA